MPHYVVQILMVDNSKYGYSLDRQPLQGVTDIREAIKRTFQMAQRGENGWQYNLREEDKKKPIILCFERTALGVRLLQAGALELPWIPPFPKAL